MNGSDIADAVADPPTPREVREHFRLVAYRQQLAETSAVVRRCALNAAAIYHGGKLADAEEGLALERARSEGFPMADP